MGKVNALILYPDMTFEEKKVKTDATNVIIDKHYSPSFSMGRSVFKEIDIPRLKFWRKPRNIIILVDGSDRAMELHDSATGEVEIGHWTRKEKEKFVRKIVAKSVARQRAISMGHFVILALMIGVVIILQIMLMKGMRFV